MSSTSQPTSFVDLYTDFLNRVRADTAQTAVVTQAKRYINIGLQDMHLGFREKLPWAERHAVLLTHATYTTGTVTISQGATALTGSGTAWNTANDFGDNNARVGGKIKISGQEVYEVSAVGSDTSITLDSAYVESDESGASYTYFEDEYALASDFLRPVDLRSFDTGNEILLTDRRSLRRLAPRNNIPGKPRYAALIDKPFSGSTSPVRRVVFARPPDQVYQIKYAYITSNLAVSSSGTEQTALSADADEPIVPLAYRHIIVLHALKNWYRDKKNDPRSQVVAQEYTDAMARFVGDHEIGSPHASFRPYRRSRRAWRGRGRRFQVNGEFDRLEDLR